jgi:transposase InsO family protein
VADAVKGWIGGVGATTAYIEKGSPWENGYVESFNARLRDELLNGEVFHTVAEARVLTERWRRHYDVQRPHSSLGCRPPAPEIMPFAMPRKPAAMNAPTKGSH